MDKTYEEPWTWGNSSAFSDHFSSAANISPAFFAKAKHSERLHPIHAAGKQIPPFFSLYPVPSVFFFFSGTNAFHYKPSFPVSPALSGNNRLFLSARKSCMQTATSSFQYEGKGRASDNPQDMHSADNPYVHCGLTSGLGRKRGSKEQDVAAARRSALQRSSAALT